MDTMTELQWTEIPAELNPSAPDADRGAAVFAPYLLEQARADAQAAGGGLPTGFPVLDKWGLRWKPGKLYAVLGRPGEGKTATLLEFLMRHVEAREESADDPFGLTPYGKENQLGPAVFVSYEENRHDIFLRLLLRELDRAREDESNPKEMPPRPVVERWLRGSKKALANEDATWTGKLAAAATHLNAHGEAGRLVIVNGDQEGGDIDTLLSSLESYAHQLGRPPSLVAIDYFQKIHPPRSAPCGSSRQRQLADVANQLRLYAKSRPFQGENSAAGYAVPVLVGSQVNREAAGRLAGLENAREGDDLVNDAAGVLSLWLPAEEGRNTLHVRVIKNRDGVAGREMTVPFRGEYSRLCGDGAAVTAKKVAGGKDAKDSNPGSEKSGNGSGFLRELTAEKNGRK